MYVTITRHTPAPRAYQISFANPSDFKYTSDKVAHTFKYYPRESIRYQAQAQLTTRLRKKPDRVGRTSWQAGARRGVRALGFFCDRNKCLPSRRAAALSIALPGSRSRREPPREPTVRAPTIQEAGQR